MTKPVITWLKQRPWLLLPALGIIPLTGFLLSDRGIIPAQEQRPSATASSPVLPTAVAPPVPTPTPKPSQSASPIATPKAPSKTPPPARPSRAALERMTAISADSVIEMRVAIAEGVSSLSVGASSDADVSDEKGRRLQALPAQTVQTVQAEGATLYLGSRQLPTALWIEPAPGGVLQVGDRSYRGSLLLVAQDSRVWAVNYVNMRDYLYSVVGSEVPASWDMAALKAQAVAARSYALVHYFRPASSLFHLGATEYYQVYGGIDREAGSIRQAVNGTAGEFVSYRGGIVESLYAASDDIVMEAFAGRGMSQTGAYELARKGLTYQQILANYYPGTGVSRIEVDQE